MINKTNKFLVPEIIFGVGSLDKVGENVIHLGGEKPFIVTDNGIIEAGWLEKLTNSLDNVDLKYELFYEITPNPKDYEITNGANAYMSSGCDSVIGIGGGSSIDAAKGIAILATNQGNIKDYEGIDKINKPLPPMIMVPTTAGTGADVSQIAIITDTNRKIKMSLISKSLVPDISIIDPFVLTTKSSELTACTGLDALTHAIEAYTSIASTPLTDVIALSAIKIIFKYLRRSVASRIDMEAKEAMAMASMQGGIAFSNANLGLVHAMAHQVGGLLDAPHGEIDAILLPHVMKFNLIACVEKYANIAIAINETQTKAGERGLAEKAINMVEELRSDLGINKGLNSLGVDQNNIPEMSKNALFDFCIFTNPRDVDVFDVEKVFQEAL